MGSVLLHWDAFKPCQCAERPLCTSKEIISEQADYICMYVYIFVLFCGHNPKVCGRFKRYERHLGIRTFCPFMEQLLLGHSSLGKLKVLQPQIMKMLPGAFSVQNPVAVHRLSLQQHGKGRCGHVFVAAFDSLELQVMIKRWLYERKFP